GQAMGQTFELASAQGADDLDHILLLQLVQVFLELALDAPVLGQHVQAIGPDLQRCAANQAVEMAFQWADTGGVVHPVARYTDALNGAVRVVSWGYVQQQGDWLGGGQYSI